MVKVVNGGVTIEVLEKEVPFYLRAGFKKVEEPVEKPAVEPAEEKQEEEPEKPVLSPEEKKALREAKKAGK